MTITRRTAATLPFLSFIRASTAPSPRPNILFFFPDQWRPDWTSFTPGLDLRTPHLEALAARGVR
ncbi:MAG: N-sulfoglucosamine sulfohydrolase, partial [Bryobacteraceae bacterium]|nr:N-sulfoglucosamine sulfohydrolase [Bryobacteraceae bacterium]